jgi:hypothetical protein
VRVFLFDANSLFIRFFLQTAAPLIKDIKQNKKLLLYIKPEKNGDGFFQ